MDELEFMMIMGMTVVLPIVILGLSLRYKRFKMEHEARHGIKEDNSVAISELREMIADVVDESTRPLQQRLDRLEKNQARALQEKASPDFGLLDEMDDPLPEMAPKTLGKHRTA